MIVLDIEQDSPAWKAARLGIPTCSQFHRLLTPKTRKPAAGAATYRNELLAEWLLGESVNAPPTGYLERGRAMEGEARHWYEFTRDVRTETVGLLLRDDRLVGGSPDALIGDDGGLEIKVPAAHVHVATLLGENEEAHYAQCQGLLMLTGRAWWDLLSYNPSIVSAVVRYEPDTEYHAALESALADFLDKLMAGRDALIALGCTPSDAASEANVAALAEIPAGMAF